VPSETIRGREWKLNSQLNASQLNVILHLIEFNLDRGMRENVLNWKFAHETMHKLPFECWRTLIIMILP
jgi:hypothetical protein